MVHGGEKKRFFTKIETARGPPRKKTRKSPKKQLVFMKGKSKSFFGLKPMGITLGKRLRKSSSKRQFVRMKGDMWT